MPTTYRLQTTVVVWGLLICSACSSHDNSIAAVDEELSALAIEFESLDSISHARIAPDVEPGMPLHLLLKIVRAEDSLPLRGVEVEFYHTDSTGSYDESVLDDESTARLKGVATTDSMGRINIRTILPGAYSGEDYLVPGKGGGHIHLSVGDTESLAYDIFFDQFLGSFMSRRWATRSSRVAIARLYTSEGGLIATATVPVRGTKGSP